MGTWTIEKAPDGDKSLTLKDSDPFDYAKAERVVPVSKKLMADFTIIPGKIIPGCWI
jgi:hypothetical protein